MDRADVLLRRAHEAGYRFPLGFSGFSATVRTSGGDTGRVEVRGRKEIDFQVDGEPGTDAGWAGEEIASMVSHRWSASYDDNDGRWAKRSEDDTVRLLDDPFDSAYRLSDGAISEVHRTVGGSRFVISVSGRVPAHDGRYLPAHFTVFHWSTDTGRLIRSDGFTDDFVLVDGVHLPARRRVVTATDEGLTTRELVLADHVVKSA
jgi:hypothetical protein